MRVKTKQSLRSIITSAYVLGLGLAVAGCSNSENKAAHHDEHAHSETHSEATPTRPETKHSEDHHSRDTNSTIRSAESHVHGGAILSIASEGTKIAIEFETPIYNLLGFEYKPQSAAEKARVSDVENMLTSPATLITFNKEAKCVYSSPNSKIKLFDDHADEHEDDDEHHDEGHEAHKERASHKDLHVSYELTCQDIKKLKSVHVEFFSVFSNFTELELVYLGPTKQMSAKLSSSRPHVDLNR